MWPKAAGSYLLFFLNIPKFAYNMKMLEFALFSAQILRAFAANTVGLQAYSI